MSKRTDRVKRIEELARARRREIVDDAGARLRWQKLHRSALRAGGDPRADTFELPPRCWTGQRWSDVTVPDLVRYSWERKQEEEERKKRAEEEKQALEAREEQGFQFW